jgi:hypothetical protein
MPAFMTGPYAINPRRGFTAGLPAYSAGSYAFGQVDARFYVSSVAIAANVVTLGVKYVDGTLPPINGQLITVRGTFVGGAAVNVTNVAITSSSITASTGLGTIVYPATAGNLTTTPDGGTAYVPVQEVAEPLAVQKWQQFCLDPMGGYGITMVWTTPSAPASIALQLEASVNDTDAEYAIIGTSQTTLAGSVIATLPDLVRFVRVNVTATAGGASPSIIAKLLQSLNAAN